MRYIGTVLLAAAAVSTPASTCSYPAPPTPPAPPFVPPQKADESDAAYRARVRQVRETHRAQVAEYDRAIADQARRLTEWRRAKVAEEDARFDKAPHAVLAHVESLADRDRDSVRIRFRVAQRLKGTGAIGPLYYTASKAPLTSCGDYDPGVARTRNGYLILLDKRRPGGKLDKDLIFPVDGLFSPRLRALVAAARGARGSRERQAGQTPPHH